MISNNLLLFFLLFSAILFFGELIKRKTNLSGELTRKSAHFLSAIVASSFVFFLTINEVYLISIAFTILLTLSKQIRFLKSIHTVSRSTIGEIAFPLGILVVSIWFHPESVSAITLSKVPFIYGLLITGISDVAANYFGTKLTSISFPYSNGKTVAGFLAFTVFSFFIGLALGVPLTYAIISASILAIIEVFTPYGLDNLFLPISAALLISIFF
jgi:dolichol kinase